MAETQTVSQVIGYVARSSDGWEGNWSATREEAERHVTVYGVENPEQTQEVVEVTGYEATCTCGWTSPFQLSEDDANTEASLHDATNHYEQVIPAVPVMEEVS